MGFISDMLATLFGVGAANAVRDRQAMPTAMSPEEQPLDDRILAFEAVVGARRGRYWAPESALPCPKPELCGLLTAAKGVTGQGSGTYERLGSLVVDLSRFIPDEDLDAALPFLNARGAIVAGFLDEEQGRERDRLVELFQAHRAAVERFLADAFISGGGPRPIGEARWKLATHRPNPRFGYFDARLGEYAGGPVLRQYPGDLRERREP